MTTKFQLSLIARRHTPHEGQRYALELWVDTNDLLTWMGAKALGSKRKRSQMASGAIVVKAIEAKIG